jgi:glycosyltransferase involved in cell wall biosynthesis
MADKYGFRSMIEENIIKCSEDIRSFLNENLYSEEFLRNLETSWNNKVKLTFAIMTFNEERCIKRCIESIQYLADEIIVIDTGSTDTTIKIINESFSNVKVYYHPWKEDFSYIRNLFSQYASNDWIFQIDADEYLDTANCEEIKKFICILDNTPFVPKVISPILIDHDLSETLHTKRIYKKDENLKYHGLIHEEIRYNNSVQTPYMIISTKFFHDGYKKEVINSKQKYERNVKLLKEMIKIEPNNIRWYYFLAREAFALEYPPDYIQEILTKGLESTELDDVDFETGMLSFLMQLNLDNLPLLSEFALKAKGKNPNLMDIYYYELVGKHAMVMNNMNELVKESIKGVTQLKDPFSLINSNGDHLFLSWGWGYFLSRNYELAFMMWGKMNSCDLIEKLDQDLMTINDHISNYFNHKQQSSLSMDPEHEVAKI